jgi:hypothetical protein
MKGVQAFPRSPEPQFQFLAICKIWSSHRRCSCEVFCFLGCNAVQSGEGCADASEGHVVSIYRADKDAGSHKLPDVGKELPYSMASHFKGTLM